MAEKISNEIFSVFGWEQVGPVNKNWSCEEKVNHKKQRGGGTHPSDAVYRYRDPYLGEDVFINIDLKSYASDSINSTQIHSALVSLARSIECAQKSDIFQDSYIHTDKNWRVDGMLFVYNHDGEFDKSFPDLLLKSKPASLPVKKGQRIAVFGPKDICYLWTVANDVTTSVARHRSTLDSVHYYAPDLEVTRVHGAKNGPATVNMLLDPWLFARIEVDGGHVTTVYYRGVGLEYEEFEYLIDCILNFQLLDDEGEIFIKAVNSVENAPELFEKAIDRYSEDFHGANEDSLSDFKKRLKRLRFAEITRIVPQFSETIIGMELR